MCGQMKFNFMISATSAHFWPLKDRENCDALTQAPQFSLIELKSLKLLTRFSHDVCRSLF
jgi:hypothetical protein